MAAQGPGGFATNGLTDLLVLNSHLFIGIERSFAIGANTPGAGPNGLPTGNTIKLVLIDTASATDVSGMDAIDARSSPRARPSC